MPSTGIRASIAVLAATAVVASGALAGCSVTRDDEPTRSAPSPKATVTVTESPSPSPSVTTPASPPTTAAASPTAPTQSATTPEAALLTAAELPRLNETARWTERRTAPVTPRPFGLCQEYDLLSIGAMSAVERTFVHGTDTAGQQLAEFADAQTAVRASKVVESWHRDCAGRVRGRQVKVRPISDVPVATGTAWDYLVSYERRGTGHFHTLGMVLTGTRMVLLRMDHDGQDHNYEPGQEPMELAVKAASAKLGR